MFYLEEEMDEDTITINIENGGSDTEITLNCNYNKGVIIIHAEMISELTIISIGSDGHDVEIEPGESYEGLHIEELFLKGENIRFHGNEDCIVDNLHIDCTKFEVF